MLLNGVIPVRNPNGDIDPHCFQMGDGTEIRAADIEPLVMPQVAPATPAAVPAKSKPAASGPMSTRALLAELRARLRVVEREIKARRNLEKERDQIKRLMAAAEQERDNLRRIRAAG